MDKHAKRLYAATLLLELLGAVARFFVGFLLAYFIVPFILIPVVLASLLNPANLFSNDPLAPLNEFFSLFRLAITLMIIIAALTALGPMLWSLLTLRLLPGGFTFTRFALGARQPSRREREAVVAALTQIASNAPKGTIGPTKWFVLDQPLLNAYVVGTTLYLTRELIKSPYLAPLIAHELGHINSTDGRLTLALRRLVIPPLYLLSNSIGQVAPGAVMVSALTRNQTGCLIGGVIWFCSFLLAVAGGGFGLWLLNPLWVWYWRQREYAADEFAAKCGVAPGLVEYLERHQFFDVATPYFMAEHPYTELRIDRLLEIVEAGGVVSTGRATGHRQP